MQILKQRHILFITDLWYKFLWNNKIEILNTGKFDHLYIIPLDNWKLNIIPVAEWNSLV